jgi:hypothetical protein
LLTPTELVQRAGRDGLSVVALTDHDTTAGLAEAAASLPAGLTLLPGAEISCFVRVRDRAVIPLHLLAYLFDPSEPSFAAARLRVRESRVDRARRMAEKIAADGHPVSWDQVRDLASGTVGRPHVAAALVAAGLIDSVAAAFTPDWIGAGGRYWVGKADIDVYTALDLVAGAGGVSVFAHPFATQRGEIVGPDVIASMADAGLAGVEVDHPDHSPPERARLRALADTLGLLVTGSSDFHGGSKPQRLGAETTSWKTYEELVSRASGAQPVTQQITAGGRDW